MPDLRKSKVKMATKKLLDSFSKTAELGTRIDMKEAVRIWPHQVDMEGFFISKMVKV